MTYTPRSEEITGADLTGSDGEINRTYELDNSNAIESMMRVMVAEAHWQQGINYTFDTSTNTITFLSAVFDDMPVLLYYLTLDSTSGYTSTLEIVRISGIGTEIFGESLGTGDGSEADYDLANGNVINGSYSIQYGDSGSNTLSTLDEPEDYVLDKDKGILVLTAAGITKVNGKAIYANYLCVSKISDTILNTYVAAASKETENITGNYWGAVSTQTDYFDGYTLGYPNTNRPFGNDVEDTAFPEFELKYKGVTGITGIYFLDFDGTVNTTLTSSEYQYTEDGRVIVNKSIPNGKRNVKITYTHGYTAVPSDVSQLASLIGAKMTFVFISGGSYDDVTGYTIGRKQFQIGEAWVNIREVISQVEKRIEQLLDGIGPNYDCA